MATKTVSAAVPAAVKAEAAAVAAAHGMSMAALLRELLAEAETAGHHPLPPEQREWVDAPAVGRKLLPEDLQTAEAIAGFLADAEATDDADYIEHAHQVAARARAMHGIG
jgi:antitoxin component of RelBE/YafQ-DinJ toxin-antitoxin module